MISLGARISATRHGVKLAKGACKNNPDQNRVWVQAQPAAGFIAGHCPVSLG